jgi:hypothetical protein
MEITLRLPPLPPPPKTTPSVERTRTFYCSFCGKSHREVSKLIAGPGVYICNECIDLCAAIVAEGDAVSPDDLERSG